MGVLSEPRLENLAQALAKGRTVIEASRDAGYKNGTSFASNARKRAQRKDVKDRVREIQTMGAVRTAVEVGDLEQKAKEIMDVPLVPDEVSASDRLKAMDFIAKLKGFYAPEKRDIDGVIQVVTGISRAPDDKAV